MIALNLTLMAALLRGEGELKRGEVGVETLGAQTKQIRKRYWREGAFSIQPLCSLIKSFISACAILPDLQAIDLDEDLSPRRSSPSSLEGLAGNPDSPAPPLPQYFSLLPRFCPSGHHHQYSHTLRPNLSRPNLKFFFHKISFLPILHHSV